MTDDSFQMQSAVFRPSKRIVTQCRAQAVRAREVLRRGLLAPPIGTPCRTDSEQAANVATRQVVLSAMASQLSSSSFAIESMMESIELHFAAERFLVVPSLVVARALLEYSATAAWILDPAASTDDRFARNCASSIRAVERSIRDLGAEHEDGKFRIMHSTLVNNYAAGGVEIQYVIDRKTGAETETVQFVRVGKAKASVNYNISQRIAQQIPIGDVYGILSSVAHGEQVAISMAGESVDTQLRALAATCFRSIEAYSGAVHAYVGAEPAPFINSGDWQELLSTFPDDVKAGASRATHLARP